MTQPPNPNRGTRYRYEDAQKHRPIARKNAEAKPEPVWWSRFFCLDLWIDLVVYGFRLVVMLPCKVLFRFLDNLF